MRYTTEMIHEMLTSTGYFPDKQTEYALMVALECNAPLLIEGAPGTGKTALALATAKGLSLPLIRAQMYDGVTADRILYEEDYQKQLLTLEALRPVIEQEYKGVSAEEAISSISSQLDFKGPDFLIERPVLQSINGKGRKVLAFDEVDKASEELEFSLLEFLEEYSIYIPGYGKIKCPEGQEPIVFLTSNAYRELSGALKRRCMYLYIHQKTKEELVEILMSRASVDEKLAAGIASCIIEAQTAGFKQVPSVAEGITWAEFLSRFDRPTKETAIASGGMLAKNEQDLKKMWKIIEDKGAAIWR